MQRFFDEADADKDGMLNLQEFLAYRQRQTAWWRQRYAESGSLPEDQEKTTWECMNKLNQSYTGLKKDDFRMTNMILYKMNMKPDCMYRIWYFDFYGRAEPIRMLLTHAGIKWEDIPVSFNIWPQFKSAVPGNSMPQLEGADGSLKGGSTKATVRYLGIKHGYYPDDPLRAQECDMIVDTYIDVFQSFSDAANGKGFDPSTKAEC